MLRHYLENAPEGFDPSVWAQASVENPDPEKLIPFPIRGFDELLDRQKRQKLEMNFQNNITADMEDHVKKSKKELTEMYAKMLSLRQKQKQFSYRLLRVLAMQTLIQRYGARLDESEVRLQYRLEQIMAHLNGPGDLKGMHSEDSPRNHARGSLFCHLLRLLDVLIPVSGRRFHCFDEFCVLQTLGCRNSSFVSFAASNFLVSKS
ncbi:hypothetical protein L596_012759 [Steinernema carpocapsae]|uniref:Nucleoporin Nup54 alpha-helical domain-containing protein n=1 Tax=Steinernema carpocapsae TaxID=34508 RepID=A0A4U5NYV1_STECR|nr:hypothetical protein L596_012759 [Steinernema carpocapsae]